MAWSRSSSLSELEVSEEGYQTYPYVIDAHTHLHRHVPKAGDSPFEDFYEVSDQLLKKEKADFIQPEVLVKEMDRYGVDKAIVNCASSMYVPLDPLAELIGKHTDRLIGFCWFEFGQYGEVPTSEEAAEQIDKALKRPEFKGVGEGTFLCGKETWPETIRWMEPMLEVVAKHEVPLLMHTGPAPYKMKFTKKMRSEKPKQGFLRIADPLFCDDLAQLYPEIPIIIGHIGVQGSFFFGSYADHALMAAAVNDNVYLETSMAPPEVISKAIADPAIGAEKLIFGSDFGATSGYYFYEGNVYPSYKKRPHPELSGYHIKHNLDVINQIQIPEEERRLILGQNISRLLELD